MTAKMPAALPDRLRGGISAVEPRD